MKAAYQSVKREIKFRRYFNMLVFLVACQIGTAEASPNWTIYKDVQYGLTSQEKADLYLLKKGVNPVVVFIHGGGWSAGDKSQFPYGAPNANYYANLMPLRGSMWFRSNIDWQRTVTRRAVERAVAGHATGDPLAPPKREPIPDTQSALGSTGDSAGGHLALFLGSLSASAPDLAGGTDRSTLYANQSPKVSAVVDMFGPTDLTQPYEYPGFASLALFVADPHSEVSALYKNASPIFAVGAQVAPICIVQGLQDYIVPPYQSYELLEQGQTIESSVWLVSIQWRP